MFLTPDTLYRIKVKVMTNPSEFEYALQVDYAGEDENRARVALTQLIEIHEAQLRKRSEYLFNQLADAEDLYSKTTLIFWSKRRCYIVSPVPWWFWARRVMSGVASGMQRQRQGELASRMQSIGDREIVVNQAAPSDALYRKEFSHSVGECLAELAQVNRHVFIRRQYKNMSLEQTWCALDNQIIENMTFEQIGYSLEIPTSTAKYLYDEAITQLKACLKSKGHSEMDLDNKY